MIFILAYGEYDFGLNCSSFHFIWLLSQSLLSVVRWRNAQKRTCCCYIEWLDKISSLPKERESTHILCHWVSALTGKSASVIAHPNRATRGPLKCLSAWIMTANRSRRVLDMFPSSSRPKNAGSDMGQPRSPQGNTNNNRWRLSHAKEFPQTSLGNNHFNTRLCAAHLPSKLSHLISCEILHKVQLYHCDPSIIPPLCCQLKNNMTHMMGRKSPTNKLEVTEIWEQLHDPSQHLNNVTLEKKHC